MSHRSHLTAPFPFASPSTSRSMRCPLVSPRRSPVIMSHRAMPCHAVPRGSSDAGRYFQVVKTQHTQQGRGGATIQVELRDVQTGLKSNEKLRTSEHIELVFSDDKPFVFLYVDEDNACLMEKQTFEQISLPVSMFGDAAPLLQDGMEVVVHLFNGKALSASLPARVSDVVDEAEPFFKGQTAAPSYKKVKLRSGITVQVSSNDNLKTTIIVKMIIVCHLNLPAVDHRSPSSPPVFFVAHQNPSPHTDAAGR
ncbi:unnamed protein product [Closterium sp. NIES-54]